MSTLFTVLPLVIYLVIIIGAFLLISKWVNKSLFLKQEQNDLLREIMKKLEK